MPLQGGYGLPFVIAGRPLTTARSTAAADGSTISPGYFDVFKIPVKKAACDFTDRDDALAPPVVIINEAFAQGVLQGQDPLNDRLTIGKGVMREFATEQERQIIGIVGDTRDGGLQQRSAAGDVHSAGAGAGRGECAECWPGANGLGGADARRPVRDERGDSGIAATVHRPARVAGAVDGDVVSRRRRGSASTCG